MPRFVLKRDTGIQAKDGDQIRKLDGVRVISELEDVAMLVEADEKTIKRHKDSLIGWTIAEETTYPAPLGPRGPVPPA